jgi:hypothetical protein
VPSCSGGENSLSGKEFHFEFESVDEAVLALTRRRCSPFCNNRHGLLLRSYLEGCLALKRNVVFHPIP